ncbi:hypothetical protein STENM36S_09550 [Streptomyces tendae]
MSVPQLNEEHRGEEILAVLTPPSASCWPRMPRRSA